MISQIKIAWLVASLLVGGALTSPLRADETPANPLAKLHYPLAKPLAGKMSEIRLITTEVAGNVAAERWGAEARQLAEDWLPLLARQLATENWTPPAVITIEMKKELAAPGITSNNIILVSTPFIEQHPDDFGLVIHELVHVIQAYPNGPQTPGWLTEGIADYIRYWKYEPEKPHRKIDFSKASYRDAYSTTGDFLAYITFHHDRRLVPKLDLALRTGQYTDAIWKETTGRTVDELWEEFAKENRN